MAKFGNKVNKSKTAKRENRDSVRSVMGILSTDIYEATVKEAYIDEKESGAMFFNATFSTSTGKLVALRECFQSGDKAKNPNATYYTDKDGVEHDMPGYAVSNEVLVAIMGEDVLNDNDEIRDLYDLHEDGDVERKAIPIYDFNAKKKVPTQVPVVVPLVGKKIRIGVLDAFVDIPAKRPDGTIDYNTPSGKSKRINQIDCFFNAETGQTYSEFSSSVDAEFYKEWSDKSKGKVYDLTFNKVAPVKDGVFTGSSGSSSDTDTSNTKKSIFKS